MKKLHLKQQITIGNMNCGISQFFRESQGQKITRTKCSNAYLTVRLNIYIQRKRIGFPIIRELKRIAVYLNMENPNLERYLKNYSHRIFCKVLISFSLLCHFSVMI